MMTMLRVAAMKTHMRVLINNHDCNDIYTRLMAQHEHSRSEI